MAAKAKFVFSGLLMLLVSPVFVFAFSLSLLFTDPILNEVNYNVTKASITQAVSKVKVKIYPSEEELTLAIDRYLNQYDHRLRAGFATWSPDRSECTIFVIDPKTEEDFETWGHELGHCIYGHWHTPEK